MYRNDRNDSKSNSNDEADNNDRKSKNNDRKSKNNDRNDSKSKIMCIDDLMRLVSITPGHVKLD